MIDNEFEIEGFVGFTNRTGRYQALVQEIDRHLDKWRTSFSGKNIRLLDLGCGDLKLAVPLIRHFETHYGITSTPTLVDPSPEIEIRIKKLHPELHQHLMLEKAETYCKSALSNRYELILASHLVYHISQNKWIELVNDAKKLLAPGGVLVFVARSLEGKFWKELQPILIAAKANFRDSYLFAEDFAASLSDHDQRFVRSFCNYTVECPQEEFLNMVIFLIRLPRDFFTKNPVMKSKVAEFGGSGTFYFEDHLFFFQR